ncbi:MAG: hypothetical protein D6785_01105 [Planctomycetota bacterium]|nr:MAG: hypothetical protein D6785_01105 [Planctomycetota bacterium]
MIRVFQEKYGAVLESYRKMGPRLVQSGLTKIRNSFQLIDEFLSLTVENYTYHLLEEVDRIENTGIRDQLFEKVRDIILIEENYRKSKGYLSILEPRSSKNELFLYRHGLIKKYCFKILHLEISPKNIEKTWHHLFYALAAGIAMAFATLVGFLAQKYFPNFSFSLLLAFVIIYMFKDRLKDIFRDLFQKWLNKRFYDRTIEILDPSYNKRLGQCKEKFYYTSFWDLDPKIQELRRLDTLPGLEVEDRGETIFCYKRRITLFSAPVFKLHSRISGLNDILRFNVKHMLTKMDEPFHEIPFIRPDTLRISRLQVPKIYHLNVVFRFSVEGDEETVLYERLRLVLNQKGIQRVERISPGGKIQKMIS